MLDEVTTIGLFLTLVSLLGSFFWVSLTAWLRDLGRAEGSGFLLQESRQPGGVGEGPPSSSGPRGLDDVRDNARRARVCVVLLVSALTLADDFRGGWGHGCWVRCGSS